MKKKRLLIITILLAILIVLGLTWRENRAMTSPVQDVPQNESLIAKGEYLVRLGNCVVCHTSENGAYLAGGYVMNTPFGEIIGTNITPSADHGIGRWNNDEFYRALTEGIAPPSRHLYPAMPYSSFHNITRDDSDALYAYLMSLKPIDKTYAETQLPFPFNQRMSLFGWNMLFLDKSISADASEGSSDSWQRGKYLVDNLGHCAMCHSELGSLGGLDKSSTLKGGSVGRLRGPDITPQGLAERGWKYKDLKQYLSKGISDKGSAFGEMYKVVTQSTQYASNDDIDAMVTYLMGDKSIAAKQVTVGEGNSFGEGLYLSLCASCHMANGSGKPHTVIPLEGNSTIRNSDSRNLIISILDGVKAHSFPDEERMKGMPEFATKLTDQEAADLVNYLRAKWGGLPEDVVPQQISELR